MLCSRSVITSVATKSAVTIAMRDKKPTLGKLCKIAALDIVVCLEKYLTQSRFAYRVIFQVELVEAMERILMCMHVEGINRQIIRCQCERLKYLF